MFTLYDMFFSFAVCTFALLPPWRNKVYIYLYLMHYIVLYAIDNTVIHVYNLTVEKLYLSCLWT